MKVYQSNIRKMDKIKFPQKIQIKNCIRMEEDDNYHFQGLPRARMKNTREALSILFTKSWSCFLSRYFSGECRQLHNIVTGVAVVRVRGVNCERVRLQLMITWEDTDHWSLVTHMTLWHTPLQHCSRDDCRTFY